MKSEMTLLEKFDQFLIMKHAEYYHGPEDQMVNSFESWINDFTVNNYALYGIDFGRKESQDRIEQLEEALTKMIHAYEVSYDVQPTYMGDYLSAKQALKGGQQ